MTKLLAAILAVLTLVFLAGCAKTGTSDASELSPAVSSPEVPAVNPESSAPDTIDPLEEAATISAPDSEESVAEIPVVSAPESAAETPMKSPLSPDSAHSPSGDRTAADSKSIVEPSSTERDNVDLSEEGVPETASQVRSPLAADMPAPYDGASAIEQELLRLINSARGAEGVEPLGVEESMQFAARIRAQEALDSLSHTRPDGTPYHTAFDEAGFRYAGKWHGENLAAIYMEGMDIDAGEIARSIFDELNGSPGHRNNMVGGQFYQTGIGVSIRRDGSAISISAAQLFAGL